jgi:aminoglycoside phosphotransferase (APT) family kinase protein
MWTSASTTRLLAELSTLGDPIADLAYLLMQWTMPGLADFAATSVPTTLDEAAEMARGTTKCSMRRYVSSD